MRLRTNKGRGGGGLFLAVARAVRGYPKAIVFVALLLAVAALAVSLDGLRLETSRNVLLGEDSPYQRQYERYRERFAKNDDLVLVATGRDRKQLRAFVAEVGQALAADDALFESVTYRIDSAALRQKRLIYLSEADRDTLRERLHENQDFLTTLSEAPALEPLLEQVSRRMSKAVVQYALSGLLGDEDDDAPPLSAKFVGALAEGLSIGLADSADYRSPWAVGLFDREENEDDWYLKSDGGRFWFVIAQPRFKGSDLAGAERVLRRVRAELDRARQRHPTVHAGVTGMFALAADEMVASRRDTGVASAIALAGVLLLFWVAFRGLRRPLLAMFTLLVSVLWTLGLATVTVGHLTVLSMAFAAILIGIGIDFGIHLLVRVAEEATRPGRADLDGLSRALQKVGPAMTAGAFTTALAFYAVMLTDFRGLAEVGWIAGSGVLMAWLASLTLLPALLVLDGRRHPTRAGAGSRATLETPGRVVSFLDRHRRAVLGLQVAVTLVLGGGLARLRFDANLLSLQAHGTESVVWENRLVTETDRSIWYAVSLVPTRTELASRARAFASLPVVAEARSIDDLLPPDQLSRIASLRALRHYVPPRTAEAETASPAVEVERVRRLLRAIRFKLGEQRRDTEKDEGQGERERARVEVGQALALLERLPAKIAGERLATFQRNLFRDYFGKLAQLAERLQPEPIVMNDIPETLRSQFVADDGTALIQIYGREDIWAEPALQRFVMQLRRIDPLVTGSPVQTLEASQAMRAGYERGALYAMAAIVVVLFLIFRAPGKVALALVPLGVGAVWSFGAMGWLGLEFNLANLVVLPLLVGIGVDSGIHIVQRHAEGHPGGFAMLRTGTQRAVATSALTSMVGFASLLVARHRGIQSIGIVLTLGIGCVLLASYLLLPALLNGARESRRRHDSSESESTA